jgi:hypothetical protein
VHAIRAVKVQRGDPIALTLGASHLDLSRPAGEVLNETNAGALATGFVKLRLGVLHDNGEHR